MNKIINTELREERQRQIEIDRMKYGKFEMPNVKVPTIKMRSATEISMEKAMVPFKMKIVKYAGQDKAY